MACSIKRFLIVSFFVAFRILIYATPSSVNGLHILCLIFATPPLNSVHFYLRNYFFSIMRWSNIWWVWSNQIRLKEFYDRFDHVWQYPYNLKLSKEWIILVVFKLVLFSSVVRLHAYIIIVTKSTPSVVTYLIKHF